MGTNDYDVSGHITVPYNKTTESLFFYKQKNKNYKLYKNGIELESATRVPISFIKKYLITRGFKVEERERIVMIPRKKVNDISIGVTKIKKGRKITELLISIHGKDMRSVIIKCDLLIEYLNNTGNITMTNNAKLWTRQELC